MYVRRIPPRIAQILIAAIMVGALVHSARAHEGPPFKIITDHPAGSFTATVWADPDIGTGTFFVVLDPGETGPLPDGLEVEVAVQPTSGRLEEKTYVAEPQDVDYGARFMTEVAFDKGGMWDVRVKVRSAEGEEEMSTTVEATPDGGIGPWGMVLYLIPFLAIGFLWVKAILEKRKARAEEREAQREAE